MPQSLPRIVVLAAIVAVLAAVLPVAGTALGPHPSFLPAFLTAASAADALTAYLLAQQWRAGASARILALGAAYAFSSFTIVVHALVFPTVVTDTGLLGAYNDTSTWLWTTWHGGFPLLLAAALAPWPASIRTKVRALTARRTRASAIAFTAPALLTTALTAVFIGLHDHLPQIISANDYSKLTRTIGPFVIAANLIGVVAVWKGARTELERWVLVVTAASFADVVLTLLADGRFTLGWYAARVLSLTAASIVLVVLLSEIRRMYREMTSANERLARKASRDSLTGVLARGAVLERLRDRLTDTDTDADATGTPFLVGLLDVDHFKAINDRHGHVVGDQVLTEVARRLQLRLRAHDLLGRYGGEEFLLILEADPRHADAIGDRLLDGLRELPVIVDVGTPEHRAVDVRASLGLVTAKPGDDATALIARADAALYRAKDVGRDRVEVFAPLALAA